MLDRPSQLANAILVFMMDNPTLREPLLVYNSFVASDSRDFGMDRGEKASFAMKMISHYLKKSDDDLVTMRRIEEKHGTLYEYGPTSSEIQRQAPGT